MRHRAVFPRPVRAAGRKQLAAPADVVPYVAALATITCRPALPPRPLHLGIVRPVEGGGGTGHLGVRRQGEREPAAPGLQPSGMVRYFTWM
jgi:hypothetical protein